MLVCIQKKECIREFSNLEMAKIECQWCRYHKTSQRRVSPFPFLVIRILPLTNRLMVYSRLLLLPLAHINLICPLVRILRASQNIASTLFVYCYRSNATELLKDANRHQTKAEMDTRIKVATIQALCFSVTREQS